ncbi:XRE family transcriptional regulator [Microbacterium sp. NPDC076911]|uniref:helix-turn-helix domain-containing protein n=1 Tax=Microbacterium sp. NPDC076911 TaxID=3154958 RepID=UPI003416C386
MSDTPALDEPASSGAVDDALIGVTLGRTIRAARTEQKLSMRALATAADISQPFLSQIESGNTMPSVVTLFRIAKALGLSPSVLFPAVPEPEPILLTRREDGKHVRVAESDDGATSRILSSGTARAATVQEYRIAGGPYAGDWFESDGEIVVYVTEGEVTVFIDGRGEWVLRAGDSLAHPGALRNRWAVLGPEPATVLLVYAVTS